MFKRILYDHWTSIVPIAAFILTSAVFLIATVRALMMSKETSHQRALLPLDGPAVEEPATQQPKA